jgi:hypothetical protein
MPIRVLYSNDVGCCSYQREHISSLHIINMDTSEVFAEVTFMLIIFSIIILIVSCKFVDLIKFDLNLQIIACMLHLVDKFAKRSQSTILQTKHH